MTSGFFIEILSRTGEVLHRHQVADLPIQIGRAYDNDFILDDVHTAAHHAVVEAFEDGNLYLRDLGSKNGLFHLGKRQTQVLIDGHSVVRLGQTNLRIRTADFAVEEEAFDTNNYNWEGLPPALTGVLMICLMAFSSIWTGETVKFAPVRYLMAMAGILSVGLVWSGIWTFANRLFAGHARFGRHVFIAACGMVVLEIFSHLSGLVAFAFSWETLSRYGSHIAIALGATMVYFHLTTIKPRAAHRAKVTAIGLSMLGSAFMLMTNYQRSGKLMDELYMRELYSPSFRVSENHTLDQFMSNAAQLKAEVDSERSKIINQGDGDGESD
jgi:pSer/pThr/pTyr-binding forkhead associated (FHA) protein